MPGDYGQDKTGRWHIYLPVGESIRVSPAAVTEHEDKTITITSLICANGKRMDLIRGKWQTQ